MSQRHPPARDRRWRPALPRDDYLATLVAAALGQAGDPLPCYARCWASRPVMTSGLVFPPGGEPW